MSHLLMEFSEGIISLGDNCAIHNSVHKLRRSYSTPLSEEENTELQLPTSAEWVF